VKFADILFVLYAITTVRNNHSFITHINNDFKTKIIFNIHLSISNGRYDHLLSSHKRTIIWIMGHSTLRDPNQTKTPILNRCEAGTHQYYQLCPLEITIFKNLKNF
jgi:hypothetical protein